MAMDCECCIVWIFKLVSTNRNFVFPFSLFSLPGPPSHETWWFTNFVRNPFESGCPSKFFSPPPIKFCSMILCIFWFSRTWSTFFYSTRVGWAGADEWQMSQQKKWKKMSEQIQSTHEMPNTASHRWNSTTVDHSSESNEKNKKKFKWDSRVFHMFFRHAKQF